MLKFTQAHGLEGIVAKRADSSYQPGLRTGVWSKYHLNRTLPGVDHLRHTKFIRLREDKDACQVVRET